MLHTSRDAGEPAFFGIGIANTFSESVNGCCAAAKHAHIHKHIARKPGAQMSPSRGGSLSPKLRHCIRPRVAGLFVVVTTVPQTSLVVFQLGEQRFALGVAGVERVVRAVEIAPLPDAPRGVRGVINLQGRIVPVFDLWTRLGQSAREVRPDDHLIIAHTPQRTVALLVDSVVGVVRRSEAQVTPVAEILPDIESISGVMKLDGSIALVYDLERFLSIEDHEKLQLALELES